MKHWIITLAAAAAVFSFSGTARAIEASEIVAKANHAAYYQGKDGKASVHMSIVDNEGRERTRDFVILRMDVDDKVDTEQKFYVYFRRPADISRTAFMVWKHPGKDDDRWMYLPALDLIKRIAASDERTSFMGSHFLYEDVSGRNPVEDDHKLIETTENYFVLESTPKDRSQVEFARYRTWVHKTTFIPVKSQYFDDSGEIYRTYEALKVETIDGYPTVTRSRMSDSRIKGQTTIEYTKVKYDISLPESIFTERYLRNAPRKYLR